MKQKITFTVEVGGRTRLGRALKKLLVLGTSPAVGDVYERYGKAQDEVAYEAFRAALRAGWRK